MHVFTASHAGGIPHLVPRRRPAPHRALQAQGRGHLAGRAGLQDLRHAGACRTRLLLLLLLQARLLGTLSWVWCCLAQEVLQKLVSAASTFRMIRV